MLEVTGAGVFEAYLVVAFVIYLAVLVDLPPTEKMTRTETLLFMAGSPLILALFILSSPVTGVFFIRYGWDRWRENCAYRRINEDVEMKDRAERGGTKGKAE